MHDGLLLVNLGSPDAPRPLEVRRYLAEFLDDPRVLDLPTPMRRLLLYLFILPFRPARSAEAYAKIWTDRGSPLVYLTRDLADALAERIPMPVAVGMRYGAPSIAQGLAELQARGAKRILLVPLYPHYAMSSYETVVARAFEVARGMPDVDLRVLPPFYGAPGYLDALWGTLRPVVEAEEPDLVLFSYHGIPERHVRRSDASGCWCLQVEGCCDAPSPAHATCYRHQVLATSRAVASRGGWAPERWAVSFQSRLGRQPWLRPYTDHVLEALPGRGVRRVVVACPSFVSDCLETLEEIGIRGRETFLRAGGERLTLVPCLNTDPSWVAFLAERVSAWHESPDVVPSAKDLLG